MTGNVAAMNRRNLCLVLLTLCVAGVPFRAPAPFVYRPGEGWSYEPVGGGGRWQQKRAKDQLDVAQAAFDKKDYGLALKAAKRVVSVWPFSDFAPQAQYLAGQCYQGLGNQEKAFNEYQKVLEKFPRLGNFDEISRRQFEIATAFLGGKHFHALKVIPYTSMEKSAGMFGKIVRNGPYSDIAPEAQLKIGAAREKEKLLWFKSPDYPGAAKAYELAADRYHDRPAIAAEGLFHAGLAYQKEALTADYDQSTAGQAIAVFTDFLTLYPTDARVPQAQSIIEGLKLEQARGNFEIARFYEKNHRGAAAQVYYNEVVLKAPGSPYAAQAQERIDALKNRGATAAAK